RSDRLSPHAGETHASRADVAVDCRLSPHAGETHASRADVAVDCRLSPHAGGTHASRADVAVDCRLSPHAGETHWVSTTITAENLRLSPHAGETPKKGHATAIGPPLIPARGGNTWQKRAAYPPPSAYPRTRGKHIKKVEGGWLVDRLSPHAGETRSKFAIPERMAALIPARGGNTADHQSPPSRPPAYPRTRGKHP